jgi:hypothetical protein
VVVADAGLLSSKNIQALIDQNYEFILGGRLKNESRIIQQKVLSLHLEDGQSSVINKEDDQKLVVSYSVQRAKKDAFNRKRGLQKLEKALATGRLTKQHINNKGYNKYLKLDGQINIHIDYEKFKEDEQWDGLKGYLTNAKLSKELVIESYKQLWFIEKAFRISKTDLRIRPVFHYRKRRILAHICIAFTAYKIYKELERQLNDRKAGISPEKAIDILKTIYSLTIITPYSETKHTRLLIKNEEQKSILKVFN